MFTGKNEKIVCTIEARMASTRLPGKVLMPLAGIPALQFQIERIRKSSYVDDIVVATTVNKKDDAIVDLCEQINCTYYRGSEMDVLDRVLSAAMKNRADIIAGVTGDCPFVDHRYMDKMIRLYYSDQCDYARMYDFPGGFGVQVYKIDTLARVDSLTDDPVDRVHVTYYIYTHPEAFKIAGWHANGLMKWPEGRIMLDEEADYQLLKIIAESLYKKDKNFTAEDVVRYLKNNPHLIEINSNVRKKTPEEL